MAESIDKILILLLCFGTLIILYGGGMKTIFTGLCLNKPVLPGLLFGLIASVPMLTGFVFTRKTEPHLVLPVLLFLDLFSPFAEEVHVRAFGFWQLRKRMAWPFWAAVIPQAILSGLGHIEKGTSWTEIAEIFLLIFSGGVIFSWLLEKWQSIWFPLFLHVFMNLWWDIFTVSDTVLGGWFAFAVQQITMLLAIGITLLYQRAGRLQP